jgi:hypothetical protein
MTRTYVRETMKDSATIKTQRGIGATYYKIVDRDPLAVLKRRAELAFLKAEADLADGILRRERPKVRLMELKNRVDRSSVGP